MESAGGSRSATSPVGGDWPSSSPGTSAPRTTRAFLAGVAEVRLLARRGRAARRRSRPAAAADSWRRGAPPIHAVDRTLDEGWEPRERRGRLLVTTAEPLARGRGLELEIVFTSRVGAAARSPASRRRATRIRCSAAAVR
ncbi:MAG: hypothetical protein R3F20_17760 [Planctomycetota bacterium]